MEPPVTSDAYVLAAGRSTRFGSASKLLAPLAGKPLIAHAIASLRQPPVGRVTAIVRSDDHALQTWFDDAGIAWHAVSGTGDVGASVVRALEDGRARRLPHLLITLGDLPLIDPQMVRTVLEAGLENPKRVTRAAHRGQPGHPLFVPTACIDAIVEERAGGQTGQTIRTARLVEAGVGAVSDIDTDDDLARMRSAIDGRTL